MKKIMLIVLALTLVFSLAACGGNTNDAANKGKSNSGSTNKGTTDAGKEPAKDEKKEDITLRMAWWGAETRHNITLEVIKMYEALNPHVTIEPEYAGWPEYWQKLGPQAAANELPDILQMDLSYLAQYGQNNQLADLTPYLGKEIDIADISDSVVSGGKLGDKLFGFNLGVNAVGFHYDKELLKTIGVAPMADDWTWDDYVAKAKEVKEKGDIYFDTGMKSDVFFNYFLRTQGKGLYGADGKSLGYEDDQLFVDHFSRLVELVKAGAAPAPDVKSEITGNIEKDPVVLQKGIGIWQWSNQFVGLQKVANRPMAMHPMPGPDADKGLFLKPSMFFSVSQNSKHKEEAAKFISFFVNSVEANKLIKGDRGIPGSSVVKEALKPLLTEQEAQVFDYIAWAEDNSSPLGTPDPVGAGEVIALLDDITEQMEFGVISVEEGAKEFREEALKILSKNK
jgi:multiple sugar transport system substrate-binding protein